MAETKQVESPAHNLCQNSPEFNEMAGNDMSQESNLKCGKMAPK